MTAHIRGFTLIEILVVLVIISIISAVAVLSLGTLGGNPAAKHAAEQLASLTDLVSQQAVMRGQQYGLLISPHGYEFLLYDGQHWLPVQNDDLLRARHLGSEVSLSLQLEGTVITLPGNDKQTDDNDATNTDAGKPVIKPQIVLLSSGEITAFKVTVSGNDKHSLYLVTGDLQHGIQFVAPAANAGG